MSSHKNPSPHSHSERNRKILLFFMVACALGFIVSLGFFVSKISDVRHGWPMHPHNPLGIIFSGSRDPLSDSGTLDVDGIELWMTFAYINFRFHLPPDLLREKLTIDDGKYPDVPLSRYVKRNSLDRSVFLEHVKDIVRAALPLPVPSTLIK